MITQTDEFRQQILEEQISEHIRMGWRIESVSKFSAVVVVGKPVNHILHLLLTALTFGFWAPMWVAISVFQREHRKILTV